ncbi:hypothetical protein [Enterococcus sp. AZ194]|uniref:hypothetical protein n=1 Tax=Enterococcus sp. AZ194 TaxID=2774629 RepID=UPI003F682DBB
MGEILFDKSRRNLKKIYNRINSTNLNQYIKAEKEKVLYLAIGGYNRTYDLLLAMGLEEHEITTHSNLNLTQSFLNETHMKKVIYIKKINYTTSINKSLPYAPKKLDLNVADAFEESLMIYETAERTFFFGKRKEAWQKPKIIILDDKSLNLQYEGHRFKYQNDIGFVQIRNRNANPKLILEEIENVEEAERMMFALYQTQTIDEPEILDALSRIQSKVYRQKDEQWFMKPTEFKEVAGSLEVSTRLKEIKELGIHQLSANKKIGKENARWIVIPDAAFEFKGFDYKDESDLFKEELEKEKEIEQSFAEEQETLLRTILDTEIPLNIKTGYVGRGMAYSSSESLQSFLNDVDNIEQEKVNGIELLSGASTDEEYKHIKKYKLAYFLDGTYKNDERLDENYLGGKRLISIDIDEGEYTRVDIENRLEQQGLFGLVYPTAKYYFNGSKRWRILLMADSAMSKDEYKNVVVGVGQMLAIEIDEASKKIAQLMGYPLKTSDVSTVIGTMVSVEQFKPKTQPQMQQTGNVLPFSSSSKSLIDFNHEQARLLKGVLEHGAVEGRRNETYRQVYVYLKDTLDKPEMAPWHDEARELIEQTKAQAIIDGLPEKEVEVIYR